MSDFDWAYGAWLGDGSTTFSSKRTSRYKYNHAFDSTDRSMVERFNRAMGWNSNITNRGNLYHVQTWHEAILPINCNSYNKRLPDYILGSDEESIKDFIQGMIDTDGSLSSKGLFRYCTVSPYLAEGMAVLLNKLRIPCTVRKNKDTRSFSCGYTYHVEFYSDQFTKHGRSVEASSWSRKSICVLRPSWHRELFEEMSIHNDKLYGKRNSNVAHVFSTVRDRHYISLYQLNKYLSVCGSSGPYMDMAIEHYKTAKLVEYQHSEEVCGLYD